MGSRVSPIVKQEVLRLPEIGRERKGWVGHVTTGPRPGINARAAAAVRPHVAPALVLELVPAHRVESGKNSKAGQISVVGLRYPS
jgi:hypothetical protein